MTEPIFEIVVRGFYTSKEADVSPSTIILVQPDGSEQLPDWGRIMPQLIKKVAEQIHEFPATEIRLMTKDEVDEFRENEKESA